MINIGKGIIAGLFASAATGGAVFLSSLAGLAPGTDPVHAISGVMLTPAGLSWVVHFAIGAFMWGPLLAVLSLTLPSPFWFKGVVFGFLAWLIMLLVSWAADPATPPQPSLGPVLFHILFGAVLGWAYGMLLDRSERQASTLQATQADW